MKVVCKRDDVFEFNRNIYYSCGCTYEINTDDIYVIKAVNYDGERMLQYYSICPKCGHINIMDDELISDEIKLKSLMKNDDDPYLFQKNNAMSELIYLNMVSKRVRKR